MKFATVQYAGKEQVALVDGNDGVFWPLSSLDVDFSGNMIQLVQKFADLRGRLSPKGKGVPLSEAKVLAPIPVPARNIFCVGKNYREHAAEFSKSGFDSSAKEG